MAKKDKQNKPQLGKQPPRYRFFLNPYEDARYSGTSHENARQERRRMLSCTRKFIIIYGGYNVGVCGSPELTTGERLIYS
jgi:hypothetical protein